MTPTEITAKKQITRNFNQENVTGTKTNQSSRVESSRRKPQETTKHGSISRDETPDQDAKLPVN
jgi:hypothetical protein